MRVLKHYRYQVTIGRHWEQSSKSRITEGICNILSVDPTQALLVISNKLPVGGRRVSLSLLSAAVYHSDMDWQFLNWWIFIGYYLQSTECGFHIRSYSFLILIDYDYLRYFHQIISTLIKRHTKFTRYSDSEILKSLCLRQTSTYTLTNT